MTARGLIDEQGDSQQSEDDPGSEFRFIFQACPEPHAERQPQESNTKGL